MKSNNKRIFKNTLLLYIRTLLTMGVSLFTVRVILDVLGTIDYGLYNVVGGVVVMFSFFSSTMSSASQRFFSFELGRKNHGQLKNIFSITLLIYSILAVIILILAETVGLWFLNYKMTIPIERVDAANWVYQLSILSFIVTMFSIPYNAVIIAREKMTVYAYIGIVEAILKLIIVYLLVLFNFDKLKLYALLMFIITMSTTLFYHFYCRENFIETRFKFFWNKVMFAEIISFSGWNLFGSLASILNNQGANIILNMFFGPVVNASRAISYRINSSISQFVLNFLTATRPQITKYYAAGEKEKMLNLVFQSSKLSYLLLFVISMPILLETSYILKIWLKETPTNVALFTRLTIITTLIDSLSYPLMTAAQATGKIKKYQITVGGIMLLSLPISYTFFKLGYPPEYIFYVSIFSSLICIFIRLYLIKSMTGLIVKDYIAKVLSPLFLVTLLAYLTPLYVQTYLPHGFPRFLLISIISILSAIICAYTFGLNKNDKKMFLQFIKRSKND